MASCFNICNSNWTEWSTIQGVIGRVISKWFEITSTITLWIVRHEVKLLINHNYNKIREEYDSGINYYFDRLIYSTSELDAEKEPIQVQLAELDDAYCPITQAWRVQLYNYGSNQGCWWPIRFENFDIVMIKKNLL